MGADLFESYVGSIIGTMVLGAAMVAGSFSNFNDFLGGLSPVLLPLILGAIGIGTSIIGTFLVRRRDGRTRKKALNAGEFTSGIDHGGSILLCD